MSNTNLIADAPRSASCSPNRQAAAIGEFMGRADQRGLLHQSVTHRDPDGRTVEVEGREVLNFGSCSTLGLETHEAVVTGVLDATRRFGTQYSSSRVYASVSLYAELEGLLTEMFGKPVVVAASTTLGHCAALPAVVGDRDAVVVDMQAHASMQMAVGLLRARGVTATVIRHNDMAALEGKLTELTATHDRVWYIADGLYSMYGDYAPLDRLERLLDTHPAFHLYIDDAHGMSWTGANGTGYVRSQIEHHDRMILAVSLNKAFAAGGGALVFPNEELAELVRTCGGTSIFSGPIPPPMLGAACASARLHLSGALCERQDRLAELIAHTNRRLAEAGLPQAVTTDSPVFFVPAGVPEACLNLVEWMKVDGFLLNTAGFPATPRKRSGVRFVLNVHLRETDIDQLVARLAHHYERAQQAAGSSSAAVARAFGIPEFTVATDLRSAASSLEDAA